MDRIANLIRKYELLTGPSTPTGVIDESGARIYLQSLKKHDGTAFCIGTLNGKKSLYLFSDRPLPTDFEGAFHASQGLHMLGCKLSWENYLVLKDIFPYLEPRSLRERRTTFGCGDRLGLATPGHLRAVRQYAASPVLAQQSIRELTLTNRNYRGVVADAAFLVFQEDYQEGYGADGDHLKTIDDIDIALDAGMPMITLDLTEVMSPAPAEWSDAKIGEGFEKLETSIKNIVLDAYSGKSFPAGDHVISFSETEVKRCALMYWRALEFSEAVDRHLQDRRGAAYDLEISIDETTAPTVPAHHFFIARELGRRNVVVNSLAPRFIGEFQKGIDYIGDLSDFEDQFKVHSAIARENGNYKISIHSGSDKFSAYPAIGIHTAHRLHLKTAGTSWLEALRTITKADPSLYRLIHTKAFEHFGEATKLYHITADLSKIPPLDETPDSELGEFLKLVESRQLLHITYGGLLNDPDIRDRFFSTLARFEELHYETVATHMRRHLELLGVEMSGSL
ncbi:MAG: hypothetical protein CMN78_00630 [Spirochaetales bacterium]|nr:hypothetical protein [Spirochaetales bacterium]